jgi:D-aspartate ligase
LLARRIRQHPSEFGRAATYVETIDQPEIVELSERFLKAIDFYGLVEVEFKQDPRDGQFKLLDVNARTWGFHTLGSAAGVDFPYLLYADQMGSAPQKSQAAAGIGWLRLITDVPTVATDLLRGRLDLRGYIQSLQRTRIESVFCASDPIPSIGEVFMLPYLFSKKYLVKPKSEPRAVDTHVGKAEAVNGD